MDEFDQILARYASNPLAALEPGSGLLEDLIQGWANSWSGKQEYLEACLRHSLAAKGPILECGSGLTTLLVGVVAQQRGLRLYSLEHDSFWAQKVQRYVHAHRIESITILLCPLRPYRHFDWYSKPAQNLPENFDLVICDGPPGKRTRGGRFGLLPCMRSGLAPGCTILLDDADRESEKRIAELWQQALGCSCEYLGVKKPYIRLVLNAA